MVFQFVQGIKQTQRVPTNLCNLGNKSRVIHLNKQKQQISGYAINFNDDDDYV